MTITRARAWHLLTAAVCAASLALQFFLSWTNNNTDYSPYARPMRMANFFSYFTIQSNLIVLAVAIALALRPGRGQGQRKGHGQRQAQGQEQSDARGGRFWRVVQLDALICITVTCLVDVTVLRPQQDLSGWSNVADLGLHVVTPVLLVAGWLFFGPRPRFVWQTLGLALVFPLAWLAYTLIRGPVVTWYPYPFIDVISHGYARVTVNVLVVALLLIGLGAVFVGLDRRLPEAPVQP